MNPNQKKATTGISVKPVPREIITVEASNFLVSEHEGASNPHPVYVTEAEGDVLYKAYLNNLGHRYEDLLLAQEEHNTQDMLANERHSSGIRGYENR